jgi:hypothetical protein
LGRADLTRLSSCQANWFPDRVDKAAAMRVHLFRRVLGPLDSACLRRAFDQVVEAQEILRTNYLVRNNQAFQTVGPAQAVRFLEFDVSSTPYPAREKLALITALQAWQADDADFASGRNMAVYLVRIASEDHFLAVGINHIAGDGPSALILLREVFDNYSALAEAADTPPPLEFQYADYAVWENEGREAALSVELEQWLSTYKTFEPIRPQRATARVGAESPRRSLTFSVAEEGWHRAGELARDLGATSAIVLYAIVGAALRSLTQQSKFSIGQIANMRPPGAERSIGCFSDLRPLTFDFSSDEPFSETVRSVRMAYAQGMDRRFRPSAPLLKALDQVCLNLIRERLTSGVLDTKSLSIRPAEVAPPSPPGIETLLRIGLYDRISMVAGVITYASDRLPAEDVQRLARAIQHGVRAFVNGELRTWRDVLADEA